MGNTDTQSPADTIRTMLAAGDNGDLDGQLNFLTDDVVLAFGNAEPVIGKQAISAQTRQFLTTIKSFRHEIHGIWQAVEDSDVLIGEMTVHYTRFDGSVVSLPCCNVFRLRGNLVADYRIYMDVNPIFA